MGVVKSKKWGLSERSRYSYIIIAVERVFYGASK